eukprot:13734346-Alexandrium_andersonii.AAC.1
MDCSRGPARPGAQDRGRLSSRTPTTARCESGTQPTSWRTSSGTRTRCVARVPRPRGRGRPSRPDTSASAAHHRTE